MRDPTMKKFLLLILDGFGIDLDANNINNKYNAIKLAKMPNWNKYFTQYPHALLNASGLAVGLPDGQFGNSEVGHLNIGAGRVVRQDIVRINDLLLDYDKQVIQSGTINNDKLITMDLLKNIAYNTKSGNLHLLGIISNGGVHGHIDHILSLMHIFNNIYKNNSLQNIYIHVFLDGRDTPPQSAKQYLKELEQSIDKFNQINIINNSSLRIRIATISGRYYAMDRDNRMERTTLTCDAIMHNTNNANLFYVDDLNTLIHDSYEQAVYDEFIKPCIYQNYQGIKTQDSILFANYRSDRIIQLSTMLLDKTSDFDLSYFVTMTEYNKNLNAQVLFKPVFLKNTLGEYLSKLNYKQLRIAETEKYPHVTYFFNGGKKDAFDNEERILIPSPKDVAKYDEKPAMSLVELTKILIEQIQNNDHKFIVVNFANPDMVGHTGNLAATIQALELVDEAIGQIVDAMLNINGEMIITSDHGNCELMFDIQINQVHTQHTHNLVPFLYIGRNAIITETKAALQDIAPSILYLLNLEQPSDMTGKNIIRII